MRRTKLHSIFSLLVIAGMLLGTLAPAGVSAAPAPDTAASSAGQAAAPEQSAAQAAQVPAVEPELAATFEAEGSAGYLIYFREKADLSQYADLDWETRGQLVMEALQTTADRTQGPVRKYLDAQGVDYQAFWIDNIIAVDSSSTEAFNGLMAYSEIEILRARRVLGIIEPELADGPESILAIEPNLTHVRADEVWTDLGITGEGSVVANIDTGVRYTHLALNAAYRGNLGGGTYDHDYNWYDPYGQYDAPFDGNGHGSHTMGTMIGDDGSTNQIGIAPGADWIACRGCSTNTCGDAELLACAQFIAAPTDVDGNNPDPSKRPSVVNNSWGDCGQSYDSWYQGVVNSWHAAAIYPVFSVGNASNCGYSAPPGLNTVGNPGRYGNVTGVGSTGRDNGQYATHSNWGPTDNPDTVNPTGYPNLKPQVLAPGVSIRSSVNSGDTAYALYTGTSMSAPHVAGLVALMWSASPALVGDYATTENLIEETAIPLPYNSGGTPPPGPGNVPNYATGWGEIDAYEAVLAAITSSEVGTLEGTVTAEGSGDPLEDATVLIENAEYSFSVMTDDTGFYTRLVPEGIFTVTVSAFGYFPETFTGVEIVLDETTVQDAALEAAPSYTVSGAVTDGATGWPLYAQIVIDGVPGDPVWTNPATGEYSVSLVAGTDYTFNVSAFSPGYLGATETTGVLNGDLTLDIELGIDRDMCVAPGYYLDVTGVYETFDTGSTPAGWTVIDNQGSGLVWEFDDPGGRGNLTGGDGGFAIVDSDFYGSSSFQDTELRGPVMDLSTLSNVYLEFDTDFYWYSGGLDEYANVDVSADGGTTWTNVWSKSGASYRGPAHETVDITAYVAGEPDAMIRFDYGPANWEFWWQVDTVFVGEKNCLPLPGGLVVGNVYDANTMEPLVGAMVENEAGNAYATVATASDDDVDDGYYVLFSPAGDQSFWASEDDYATETVTVTVPLDGAVSQDFYLGAGWLTYTPDEIDLSAPAGSVLTVTMTIDNMGILAADYTLNELDRGSTPFGAVETTAAPVVPSGARLLELSLSGKPAKGVAAQAVVSPNDDVALILDDGSAEDSIGLTAGGQFLWFNRFTPDPGAFPFTLSQVQLIMNDTTPVGADLQLVIWQDADSDPTTGAEFLYAEDVVVQDNDFLTWNVYDLAEPPIVSGPGDVLIGVVNRDGTSGVSDFPAAIDQGASQGRSWIGLYSANPPNPPTLPADSDFGVIDDFGLPGNWTLRGYGMTGGGDVVWLSTDPMTGTIPAAGSQEVVVTLDSTTIEPGIYEAEIGVGNNTPYSVPNLPVKFTVTVPPDWGRITGHVSTPGYCDANPAFLEGVEVYVESWTGETWTLETDENGEYSEWMPAANSPLTITVDNPMYEYAMVTGVMLYGQEITTQDFDLRYLAPCISVSPTSMTVNLNIGQSTTRLMRVFNNGAASTPFTMTEQSLGGPSIFIPEIAATEPQRIELSLSGSTATGAADPVITGPNQDVELVLDDGSAEDSIGLTSGGQFIWLNRFTPDAGSFPFTLDQIQLLMSSSTSVGANLELVIFEDADGDPTNGANFLYSENVTVQFNNNTTWNVYDLAAPVALNGPGDVLVGVVNRSGASGLLDYPAAIDQNSTLNRRSWVGIYTANPPTPPTLPPDSDFGIIDDFGLAGNWTLRAYGSSGGGGGADVVWLTETPVTGTIAADSMQFVTIGFDANAVAEPGEYRANVKTNTEDPEAPAVNMPATMNVTAPANWGILEGAITSMGYCDMSPEALAGATVTLTGSNGRVRTVTSAGDGSYLLWLDSLASPFSMLVEAPGHLPVTVTGITVSGNGAVTVQDADLRLDAACVGYTPESLDITLDWGATGDLMLTLSNDGAASAAFTLTEQSPDFIPMATDALAILVVNDGGFNTSQASAMTTALAALGETWTLVSSSSTTGIPAVLTDYDVVLYAGTPSSGAEGNQIMAYLDAGGKVLIADNDFAYTYRTSPVPNILATYFQAAYVSDSGSDGVVVGSDIMAGISTDVSSDPFPDDFSIIGADATGIFQRAGFQWGGEKIDTGTYKAIFLAWDYHYADGSTVGGPAETAIMEAALEWLTFSAADALPWVSEDPAVGSVAADGTTMITATFDAGVAEVTQPGTYTGVFNFVTTDENSPEFDVPVSMTVNPPDYMGKLMGTVYSLGYCDINPVPAAGAEVIISNAGGEVMVLETDADGMYSYWLDEAGSPYTVTASADEHITNSAMGDVTGLVTTTLDVELRWDRACVTVDPTSLTFDLEMGMTATQMFDVMNTGAAATDFEIKEAEGGFAPAAADVLIVNDGNTNATSVTAFQTALTNLGYSYDTVVSSATTGIPAVLTDYVAVLYAGYPSAGAEDDQLIAYMDAGGHLLIADNDFGYWRDGSVIYSTYLQADYQTDAGSDGILTGYDIMAGLSVDVSSDPYPDDFTIIGPDAVAIFQRAGYQYGGLAIDAGYKAIYLAFDFYYAGGSTAGDPIETDVIERAMGFLAAADVPWMSADPTTGTLPADTGMATVYITADADVDQPGTYTAAAKVRSDDPMYSSIEVPVTMNVTAPASWGKLEGTVESLGYCDSNPYPAEGAEVYVEATGGMTYTLTADAAGYYSVWMDEGYSPLTITVMAPEHITGMASGVAVTAGMTTTQDFDLRWLHACVGADPTSFDVTLMLGESTTEPLTLTNRGAAGSAFELETNETGFTPSGAVVEAIPAPAGLISPLTAPSLAGQYSEVFTGRLPEAGAAPEDYGDAWETMASMPEARAFNGVVAAEDYIFVIGGTSDAGGTISTNSVFRYDTATDSWATMATVPAAVSQVDGEYIDGKIYIPGDSANADTFVYDVAANSWSTIPVNGGYAPRGQYQTVAMGSDLYVLGGIDSLAGASSTEVWILDTTTGTWSAGVPMQQTRTSFSAGVVDGEIFVAGGVVFPGFTPTMTTEKFDGATWSYVAPVPSGGGLYTRWSYNADGVGEDGLWLGAGRRDAGWAVVNHAGFYTPETDSWTDSPTVPTLNLGRVYMEGAVGSDGYFYVIGGRDPAASVAYDDVERLYVGTGAPPPPSGWLFTDPITGTLSADSEVVVDVIFSAETITMTGVYEGEIRVHSDDPMMGTIVIPVTLTVHDYGVDLAAVEDALTGDPAETVTYELLLTNSGTLADVYDLSAAGNDWDVQLSDASVAVGAGETVSVFVDVTIPADAEFEDSDMVTITATSQGDSEKTASVDLTTTVGEYFAMDAEMDHSSMMGIRGEEMTATLTVMNMGTVSDSYTITLSGHNWDYELEHTVLGPVAAGGSASTHIWITIPADAPLGSSDTVTITITSHGNPAMTIEMELNVALMKYIFMPVASKAPAP